MPKPESPTALTLPDNLPFRKWEEIGTELCDQVSRSRWHTGDWMLYGMKHYPKDARSMPLFLRAIAELSNEAHKLAKAIAPENRRADLAWAYHREVYDLEPDAQRSFLERAKKENLNLSDFRRLLRTSQAKAEVRGDSFAWSSATRQSRDLVKWLKNRPPSFWNSDTRRLWAKELEPLAELARSLTESQALAH